VFTLCGWLACVVRPAGLPCSFPDVRHEVRREWREMRRLFLAHDGQRGGVVPVPVFRKVLRKFGILLDRGDMETVEAPFRAPSGSSSSPALPPPSSRDGRATSRHASIRYNDFLRAQLQQT